MQPYATAKALPGRPHGGKAALPKPDLVHSQCTAVPEGSCSQDSGIQSCILSLFIRSHLQRPSFGTSAKTTSVGKGENLEDSFSPLWLSTFPLLALLSVPALSHGVHNTAGVFSWGLLQQWEIPHLSADLPDPPLACYSMGENEFGSWCFLWCGLLLILSQQVIKALTIICFFILLL